jgi:hypothetical protein
MDGRRTDGVTTTGLQGDAPWDGVHGVLDREPSNQSGGGSGELAAEPAASLTVRVEDLDLPVVVTAESAELRCSPREHLETFSIRG